MKIFITAALLLVSLTVGVFGQITRTAINVPKDAPANFKTDGCTFFPDGDYKDCCVAHDLDYFKGGSLRERWRSDKRLFQCVANKKGWWHKVVAPMMWTGVRVGGVSFLPTPFRWGFGRRKNKSF
ncbi:MAG: hypothetical protein M3209_09240 [Acidobacteriota bacterium]|nr:hypothetical protein [Acidobacteriota bacterium]